MKRNYEKEIKIFKEMLIKGVSNDIILQTLSLFENYNENEEEISVNSSTENNITSKIDILKEEVKIENVMKKSIESKIETTIKECRNGTKIIDINKISKNYNYFIELSKNYNSLMSSDISKHKLFFGYSDKINEYKVLLPIIDKELMINFNTFLKNIIERKILRMKLTNKIVINGFIEESKRGFKIIFNKKGDKEITFGFNPSLYNKYKIIAYNCFYIGGLSNNMKNIINKSGMISNNFEFDSENLSMEFNFNIKESELKYDSIFRIEYSRINKKFTPYRIVFSNSGITHKLKSFTNEINGVFNDFNSKFNSKDYNVYINNNILVVVPKNKNIKNEFIKNFMLNDNIHKLNVKESSIRSNIEKSILIKTDEISSIFYSKFEQFSPLLDIKESVLTTLRISVKTTHILEEDSWIFDFSNISTDNLIL